MIPLELKKEFIDMVSVEAVATCNFVEFSRPSFIIQESIIVLSPKSLINVF